MSSVCAAQSVSTKSNKRHEPITLALPIQVSKLICSVCRKTEASALCIGCYDSFCLDCLSPHRQKIFKDFDNLVYEHELFQALFNEKSSEATAKLGTASTKRLNPLTIHEQIDIWEENLANRVNTTANAARQNLSSRIHERYDAIFKRFPTIKQKSFTREEAEHYVKKKLQEIKSTLCEANHFLEGLPSTQSVHLKLEKVNVAEALKITSTQSSDVKLPNSIRPMSSCSTRSLESLEFSRLSQPSFKKIEHLGSGMAIGASDKYVIYTDESDLCMVELSKHYRVVIPLEHVVDICWCAEADYFIILTKNIVYTFSPNANELDRVDKIELSGRGDFWRCTYASNTATLLLCYSVRGSPIEEWKLSNFEKTNVWKAPHSCEKTEVIQCMRVSSNGSCIALTVNDGEQDYFIVRDRVMGQKHRMELRIVDCFSFISFPNNTWLLSILNFNKLFFIENNYEIRKITQTAVNKASTKGIALVGVNIVAERTASTICFFRL